MNPGAKIKIFVLLRSIRNMSLVIAKGLEHRIVMIRLKLKPLYQITRYILDKTRHKRKQLVKRLSTVIDIFYFIFSKSACGREVMTFSNE